MGLNGISIASLYAVVQKLLGGRVALLEIPEEIFVGELGCRNLRLPRSKAGEILAASGKKSQLFLEISRLVFPVFASPKMWERRRKGRVVPAPGDPSRVAYKTQCPERLHEAKPTAVKAAELLIGVDQERALPRALAVAPGKEHPDVLHRRADHEVVEIEKEPSLPSVKEVSEVTVAVDGVERNALAPRLIQRGHFLCCSPVASRAARGEEAFLLEESQGLTRKGLRAKRWPIVYAKRRADIVDPSQEPAQDRDLIVRELGGRASPRTRPDRIVDALDLVERRAVAKRERRTDWNLRFPQCGEKGVLLENRGGTPAPGTVELYDHVRAVFEVHIVNTIFEAGERRRMARRPEAPRLDSAQHPLGCQPKERFAHTRSIPETFARA